MSVAAELRESFSGGLGKALAEVLLPGEDIVASLNGLMGQAIAVTARRVIIVKGGLASGSMFGRKAKAFRLEHITSVEYSCGLTEGRVQLTVAGAKEQQQGWTSRRSFIEEVAESRQAETVCQFPSNKKKLFQALSHLIEDAIETSRQSAAPSTTQSSVNIPEQIRQLAELEEQGIISKDEFEKTKKRLLSQLTGA